MSKAWVPTEDTVITVWTLSNKGHLPKDVAKMTGIGLARVNKVLKTCGDPAGKVSRRVVDEVDSQQVAPAHDGASPSSRPTDLPADGVFE